tara:strand:+ start:775 stop:930 length:156 start_codon:yes stop_codon:yes gene_type:complete
MFSSVAQPIGIGQCLSLNLKKQKAVRASIKKKNCKAPRSGFSKKHLQLAIA